MTPVLPSTWPCLSGWHRVSALCSAATVVAPLQILVAGVLPLLVLSAMDPGSLPVLLVVAAVLVSMIWLMLHLGVTGLTRESLGRIRAAAITAVGCVALLWLVAAGWGVLFLVTIPNGVASGFAVVALVCATAPMGSTAPPEFR